MPYVEQSLLPHERVVHCGQIHWAIFVPGYSFLFVGLLFGIGLLANIGTGAAAAIGFVPFGFIGGLLLLAASIRKVTTEMAVTDQRVIIKVGLISRKTIEMNLAKIENIQVEQGILGRLLGYGTITVVGTGGTREPFGWIVDPMAFRKAVQAQSHN
jgi:uncharacterized membrane protein YdbT with pleckstrin-like domain